MTYAESFTYWMPIMQARWAGKSAADLFHAKRDILETLPLHTGQTEYSAKLWAELDAIRDEERKQQRAA